MQSYYSRIVTHLLLLRYHRCEFSLELAGAARARSQAQFNEAPVHVSPFTKWETIAEKLKPSERPVVLNRASSTNTTNPFGSTFCYGYQDIIFEVRNLFSGKFDELMYFVQVMPNGHIASVSLCLHTGLSPCQEGEDSLLPL